MLQSIKKNQENLLDGFDYGGLCYHCPDLGFDFSHTQSQEEVEAYHRVRERCYQEDLGIDSADTQQDLYDAIADTLIIKKNRQVIGGCRIISSMQRSRNLLQMEKDGLNLQAEFRTLQLETKNYCEMSRLAILKDYRSAKTLDIFIRFMFTFCINKGLDYLFVLAPSLQARCYKKMTRRMGFDYTLLHDMSLSTYQKYPHLEKMTLCAMPFDMHETIDLSVIYGDSKVLMSA